MQLLTVKKASNCEGSNSGMPKESCVIETQVGNDQVGVESMELDEKQLPIETSSPLSTNI